MKIKATSPQVKKTKAKNYVKTSDTTAGERNHAPRVWNKVRPKKGVAGAGIKAVSKIKNFAKLTAAPPINYAPESAHFAPGVPNTAAIRKGYTPPGTTSKKIRGGATDTEGDAPAHTTYAPA